jgi:UTP--glucose-1-phosphate uridylyltransferase
MHRQQRRYVYGDCSRSRRILTRLQDIPADAPVRDGMTALELTLAHLSHLNATYGVSIPLVLVEPFAGALHIAPDRQPRNVPLMRVRGSRLPLLHADSLLPVPTAADDPDACWYAPGTGDVFDVLQRKGIVDSLRQDGKNYIFVSSVFDVGAMWAPLSSHLGCCAQTKLQGR